MTQQPATGQFDVQLTPENAEAEGAIYRFTLTKTWRGDLRATGRGVMLSGGDPTTGCAGYVAAEVVEGTLAGRQGTFLLQQFGDLDEGRETLHYQVVNGSATGELAGLRGRMDVDIDTAGVHHYILHHTLPEA